MRIPNFERRKAESRTYKMGYEIRLAISTKRELAELRRMIRAAGLKPGKPFAKETLTIQPIYGRQAMDRFMQMLSEFGDDDSQLLVAKWHSALAERG